MYLEVSSAKEFWCRLSSPPNKGVDGNDESDLTLTSLFVKFGDENLLSLQFEVMAAELTLAGLSDGGDRGRVSGEPVHPWNSRSDAWVKEKRIWSLGSIDQILQKLPELVDTVDDEQRSAALRLNKLHEVDLFVWYEFNVNYDYDFGRDQIRRKDYKV